MDFFWKPPKAPSWIRGEPTPGLQPELPDDPDVRKTVVAAYYPAIVNGVGSTRSRAQNAYAIAAAIATALVTAGALTGIQDRSGWVKAVGLLAVMGWVATALTFMLAVGGSVRTRNPDPSNGDTQKFVDDVVRIAREEASIIGGTIDKAWVCALVAAGLTVLALIFGFIIPNPVEHDWREARIALSKQGQATFSAVCDSVGTKNKAVEGSLDIESLSSKYAAVKVLASVCYPQANDSTAEEAKIEIKLPPAQILGYARKLNDD